MRMAVRAFVLITTVWLAAAALAQPRAASGAEPPGRVQLLDEVPNYAEILAHQWINGPPHAATEAEQSTEHYGRLLDSGAPQALSVDDAVALAIQHNTNLRIQRLGPLSAAAQVRRARAVFDAVLFGDVSRSRQTTPASTVLTATDITAFNALYTQSSYFDTGVRKTFVTGGQVSLLWTNNRLLANPSIVNPLVPQYTTTLGLSLNQPLLRDFGWRYALLLVEVAEDTERAAYHQYEASLATLITQVERAYWAHVLAIEQVRVQEQGLALANEVLRQNQGKFNVGALPRTAVLEAETEVARREAILIQARNFRDVTKDNLRALINYPAPSAGPLALIEPGDRPTVSPYDVNLDRSLRTALEQRPELLAARLAIRSQGLQEKIAENQLLPRLNFVGAMGVNGLSGSPQSVTFSGQTIPVPPELSGGYGRSLEFMTDGRFYNYSAGATVEVPLGNSQAKADYATAKINFEQARLSLQNLEETVTLEIKLAVSNLGSDLKSIDATRIARELAEENVRNQQARYDVGLATTKDLLDFQDRLTQARAAEVQALTAYNIDLAEMRRVEGTLLSARNVIVERAAPGGVPWWEEF
jgi:outer membrane protein